MRNWVDLGSGREIQFVDKKSNRFSRCGQGMYSSRFRGFDRSIDDTTFFEDRYYREEISILGMEIGCSPEYAEGSGAGAVGSSRRMRVKMIPVPLTGEYSDN